MLEAGTVGVSDGPIGRALVSGSGWALELLGPYDGKEVGTASERVFEVTGADDE